MPRMKVFAAALVLAPGLASGLAGCATEGDRITTGALKPAQAAPKAAKRDKRDIGDKAEQTPQPGDARKIYCDEMRKGWKPGDLPPSESALSKRRADNIYCSG